MRAHEVHVEHDFRKPPERIFAALSEHENLSQIFPARVERVRDGDDGSRNGVGSVRRLLGPGGAAPFEETVTDVVPNQRIEYKITKGSPMRGHVGVMEFSELPGGGTHLDYRIRLASPIPGLALLVKTLLTASVRKGLPKIDDLA